MLNNNLCKINLLKGEIVMEPDNNIKLICLIIFSDEKSKGLLCDALIEIIPGFLVSDFKLINGKFGRFLSLPHIYNYKGKKKRVKVVTLSKKLNDKIFNLINDSYEKYLSNKEVDFKVIDKRNINFSGFKQNIIDDEDPQWDQYKNTGYFDNYDDFKTWQHLADIIGVDPHTLKWNLD
jgi:DNA-binding cell septation regulator SpoVG